MRIALLTGGGEKHYQLGLLSGLLSVGLEVELVGNDAMAQHELVKAAHVHFYNLRGSQDPGRPMAEKVTGIVSYYLKLVKYAATTECKILHIQWDNRFYLLDRIVLILYYKILSKKIVYTAHNIDGEARDGRSTLLNRLSLWFMYHLVDHVIVHTQLMKEELRRHFGMNLTKVSVVSHGINSRVRVAGLTREEARNRLSLGAETKVLLSFGGIAPYKGIDLAISALKVLCQFDPTYYLIIAGGNKNRPNYIRLLENLIAQNNLMTHVSMRNAFIADNEIETYFVAADCCVLPYRAIFQSGVVFLSLRFGLPIVAADVGALREVIDECGSGFVCKPNDPTDLAETIQRYFAGELYRDLPKHRRRISELSCRRYSWDRIAAETYRIYEMVAGPRQR
jgi:D-inositol-3-phosphate glycosyltransferase